MIKKYLKIGLILFVLVFCLIGCKKEKENEEIKQQTQINKNNNTFKSERVQLTINDNDIMFPGMLKDFFCIVEFQDDELKKKTEEMGSIVGKVKGYYDTEIEFILDNNNTIIENSRIKELVIIKDPNKKFELPKEITMANTYKDVLEIYGNPNINDEKDGERIIVYTNLKNNYSLMMKFEKEKMTEIRLKSMIH